MEQLESVQRKLQRIRPELVAKYHVSSIGLFGSIVRNDFTDKSDIDIVVDFSQPIGIEFIDLANELEMMLDRKVDLVSKKGILPAYMQAIQSEILYV